MREWANEEEKAEYGGPKLRISGDLRGPLDGICGIKVILGIVGANKGGEDLGMGRSRTLKGM